MARDIPESMQQDIEKKLKQMMDNPKVKISKVADQWWEFTNEKGELLVKLFDKPTYRDDASLEFFGEYRYSLLADVRKRLLDYAAQAQYNRHTRGYVAELNRVLEEINKYGKNPNFEGFKIVDADSEAISKAVEAVAMNLIHNPSNPVENIIIGEQLIDIQNVAGEVLIRINLHPYNNDPNVKLMGKNGTIKCHLEWDAVQKIQKAIFTEINSRRIRAASVGLQQIIDGLAPYTTPSIKEIEAALTPYTGPNSNNSGARR